MGIASIVLGVLSMILAIAGFLLSWVPVLGALLSFGSPVLALIGAVLGGVGLSRAKEEGGETGVPMAGLIVSIIAFFPGLLVALTCGVCNSMCAASSLSGDGHSGPAWYEDGGLSSISPGVTPTPLPPVDPNGLPTAPPIDPNAVPPPDPANPNGALIDPTAVPDPNAADPNAADPNAADPNAADPNAGPNGIPPPPDFDSP